MWTHCGYVMTLANSIIGVGILAMPFCFQKCGIVLAILLLILSNWLTRICCYYLIKSSLITRRKCFEFLGFHAFGPSGKLLVELCIIGYLLGTCITYFVVVGDLGPQIVTKMFDIQHDLTTRHLRTCLMSAVTIFCILPLAMLKNVDSLSIVCTASIGFYICLVVKIILESQTHIVAHDWQNAVAYWQPQGILQCLPIFSMALSCQMQIFEVFNSINNQSLDKLNGIVRNATWICTLVYISMGFFGYVAFCTQTFSGNILINLKPSFSSDIIKIGFVLSVAFSFPLVIFPCRASLYSLLYRKGQTDSTVFYIPERRFKVITFFIVIFSLAIALMIPSVELIIGLVGSTIGVAICIMFPAACFRKIIQKDSTERNLAQLIVIGGFCLMILGTYANLSAMDAKNSGVQFNKLNNFLRLNDVVKRQQQQELDNNNQYENILMYSINAINQKNMAQESVKIDQPVKVNDREQFKNKVLQQSNKINEVNTSAMEAIVSSMLISPPSQLRPHKPQLLPIDEFHNDHFNVKQNKKFTRPSSSISPTTSPQLLNKSDLSQINTIKEDNFAKPRNVDLLIVKQHTVNRIDNDRHIEIFNKSSRQIDIDAIKKEEAEIRQHKMKQEQNNEELENTQNELKKTKEIFEKRVQELKVELAKQNQETQNLVEEKLGKVVEKFKQIERKVEQQQKQQEQEQLAESEQIISKRNDNNNIDKIIPKTQEFKYNNNILKKQTAYNDLEILEMKKINKNLQSDEINKINIYETDSPKSNVKQSKPLPLALLINNTNTIKKPNNSSYEMLTLQSELPFSPPLQKVEDVDKIKQQVAVDNNNNHTNIMNEKSVDTIRRDLLQLKMDNQGNLAVWAGNNKSEKFFKESLNQKEKRSPTTNSYQVLNEKTENDHGNNVYDIKKTYADENVQMQFKRDLKSIHINNR